MLSYVIVILLKIFGQSQVLLVGVKFSFQFRSLLTQSTTPLGLLCRLYCVEYHVIMAYVYYALLPLTNLLGIQIILLECATLHKRHHNCKMALGSGVFQINLARVHNSCW